MRFKELKGVGRVQNMVRDGRSCIEQAGVVIGGQGHLNLVGCDRKCPFYFICRKFLEGFEAGEWCHLIYVFRRLY